MPEQSNDYRVAVFGAGGVGKSSIVQRFVTGDFSDSYVPTIEDTYRKVITCNNLQGVCTLQFPAMQRLSISRGHAFILVFDVCKEESYLHLLPIYQEIKAIKGTDLDYTPMMLVGNKIDGADRKIRTTQLQAQAAKWGCGFIETSAKNNVNITELFEQLLALEKRRNLSLTPENDKGKKAKKKDKKTGGKGDAKGKGKGKGKGKDKDKDKAAKEKKSEKKGEQSDSKKSGKAEKTTDADAATEEPKKKCVVM